MSKEGQPILSVSNLTISFDKEKFTAVNNVSFSIDAGETLAVVGESGSGKSLTAFAILGLLPKEASVNGSLIFRQSSGDVNLAFINASQWPLIRGGEIGIVFQEPMSALNPVMKIGKQLQESIQLHSKLDKKQCARQTLEWLDRVRLPNPDILFHRYPHQLSGGQKQRVMIAMAMCNRPKLLIADEPTTALDVTVQKEIIELMQDLQRQYNMGMMFITHDLSLAGSIADKIMVMYKGEVAEQGDARVVLRYPRHPYTTALIACKPTPAHKGTTLPTVSAYLSDMTNKSADIPVSTHGTDSLLEVNGLKVWFENKRNVWGGPRSYFKAVNDVSFILRKGETLGLVGESGCGKSTISRSLMGLLPIKEGEIIFENRDLANLLKAEWNIVRKDIQMVFQDPYASLNPRMIIGDILSEPLLKHNIVPGKEIKTEVARLLDMVHLPVDSAMRYPHQFSGGQRQRIGIARALSVRPKLLICDESVSALDVSVQAQILNLLKELQADLGLSYLFVSHDLNVVYYMSDRVLVMKQGLIVEKGDAKNVLLHPSHPYTRRLIDAMPKDIS